MLDTLTARGSAKDAETRIDRTRILDPKDFWPKATDCPDWPHLRPSQVYMGARGKAGAEARLEHIGTFLNRGTGTLCVPSDTERDGEFARTFRRSGGNWYHLGINNLSPLGRMVEDEASLIVEACHIRGYLRKLEAIADQQAEAAEQRKKAEARRTLEDYRAKAPGHVAEIKELAEAVARHRQREEDERAVGLDRMHRDQLDTLYSAAVSAAHTLGLSVPDAPHLEG